MMADLKELIKQRGNIRGRITLFEKYLSPLMNIDSKTERNKLINNELSLRTSKLQELSYSFDDIQSKIEQLDPDTSKQLEEREQTENQFFRLLGIAQAYWDAYCDCKKREDEALSQCSSTSVANHIKLPPLKLPPFDGDINKWLQFRDMYLSVIHNNETIDNISKFHYLKSYLEGSALSVINSVNVSADNYEIAWSLLCDRYNNKRLLINEHIKCLLSVEALSKESARGLRNLVDTISKNLSALKLLGEPTDSWSTLIIYIGSAKLDSATARNWEEFRSKSEKQTLDDFFNFLRERATVLETVYAAKTTNNSNHNKLENRQSFARSKSFIASSLDSPPRGGCFACKQDHKLYECHKFKSLPVEERNAKVFQWRICSNCLHDDHQSYQCRLAGCRICKRKHNIILHKPSNVQSNTITNNTQPITLQQQQATQSDIKASSSTSLATTTNLPDSNDSSSDTDDTTHPGPSPVVTMSAGASNLALLSTAMVEVSNNGKTVNLRALLDSGSQSSFITEGAQAKLACIKHKNQYKYVSGLNNATISIAEHCNIQIKSNYKQFNASVKCYVVPNITDKLPQAEVYLHELGIPGHIELADPTFFHPSEIDLLLGADIFWDIMGSSRVQLGPNKPILQETQLGWIVAGPMGGKYYKQSNKLHCHFSKDIQQQLSKFWELEDVPISKPTSNSEDYCEKLYRDTTCRDANGRFCVQIPLCDSPDALGDSYHIAEKRLLQMERKMRNKPAFKEEYIKFMQEYERLEHMSEVSKPQRGCYIPHHAVIRESSETTKLRVVFDASAKTSSGVSFNDIQHVGPVVQDDLFSILLRFRQHQYVITADVEKMYRQILVQPEQRHLQMILWREHEDQPIKIYKLNTISYGTSSAPFLSTRCLVQLAEECHDDRVANIIKHDFYVDDFITGSHSKEDLRHIVNSVTETLHSAHLPLRKFRTNVSSVLLDNTNSLIPKDLDFSLQSSALGLKWNPNSDKFNFPVDITSPFRATKRSILSNSARLFDPLGLLCLCTIVPKIILQKLWMSKLDWDDPIPHDLEKMWLKFVSGLNTLVDFKVTRFVLSDDPNAVVEMHTFCDASQDAYAACVYLRSISTSGDVVVNLLCAKTKVAPLQTQTIPRLELCGALLAARLSTKVLKAFRLSFTNVYYWTDSTVVLGWVHSPSQNLKAFVSNRVAQIQELTSIGSWRHVPGVQNPADLASRGLSPSQIHDAHLWWHGPTFLGNNSSSWPDIIEPTKEIPEIKTYKTKPKPSTCTYTTTCTNTTSCTNPTISQTSNENLVKFENFSKFTILLRSLAYVLRFINNVRKQTKTTGHLTVEELKQSLHHLVKQHQEECFERELELLNKKRGLPAKSRLLSLNPFVDDKGILRVGGRLQNSPEIFSKKHPIILESKHNFTKLLFIFEHKKLCHGGAQLLLTNVRQSYWPIAGRRLARSTVNNCRLCRILQAKAIVPLMGNLPFTRVTPSYAFEVAGVDFAGPYLIRDRKGRGCRIIKSYLCIIVCYLTKALHLEAVSSLSAEAFIMCLTRFIGRRGRPSQIHCDNGRNFVGANNEFKRFLESCKESISSYAASEFIEFKFSPAYSPHFNGLSEAGVKSAKHHLTRMIGNNSTHFTFEELSTLLTQIEAILNSRPLTPLSSDPSDLYPLCPGHFLIGKPLTSLPSPAIVDLNPNRLNRYEQIEQIRQQFWERWRKEFLNELQQRSKWRVNQGKLSEGEMVVLKEPNLPPLKWRMGRIHRLYPGSDGIARVADVNTSKGILRRAVTNLCPLPDGQH